eukprot:gene4951-biopygen1629
MNTQIYIFIITEDCGDRIFHTGDCRPLRQTWISLADQQLLAVWYVQAYQAAYGPRSGAKPWCPAKRGETRQKNPSTQHRALKLAKCLRPKDRLKVSSLEGDHRLRRLAGLQRKRLFTQLRASWQAQAGRAKESPLALTA